MGAIKLFGTLTPVYYWNKRSKKKIKINQGGTNCFHENQEVITLDGPKPIGQIKTGDFVKSFNHDSNEVEYRRVLNKFKNKNEKDCIKILTTFGEIICTEDHRFYYNNSYIQIKEILNNHARDRRVQQLLCRPNGEYIQQELQEDRKDQEVKSCIRWGWLPENYAEIRHREIYNGKGSQNCSPCLSWIFRSNSQPCRRNQDKQPTFKFRIPNPERKCKPCISEWISQGKERFSKWNDQINGISGNRNKSSNKKWGSVLWEEGISPEIQYFRSNDKRYCNRENLELSVDSIISWESCNLDYTYDIEVEYNHNFFLDVGDTLVHNSGKTYGIIEVIIDRLCRNDNWVATVTAESWPTLERGALRDFKSIIRNSEILKYYIPNHRLKKGPYEFYNGSKLEFVTVKDPLDARHGKRQILFANEVNAMSYDTVEEMVIRSDQDVFLDYNPNAKFWVHDLYKGKKHVDFFISNYTDNRFCPIDVKRNIGMYYTEWKKREALGDASFKYWRNKFRVYGLGLTGIVQGVVFENVYYRPTFPTDLRSSRQAYVIDWGYTNDPLAMALCGEKNGNLYGKELIYETKMTTPRLIKRMQELHISKSDLIIADNSNWDGIGQLKDAGYNVIPATKGPNSVKTGVNLLQGYNIWLTEDSYNWKVEQENYKYQEKNGIFVDEPEDKSNHLWDCLRYFAQTKLVKSKPGDKKRKKRRANV